MNISFFLLPKSEVTYIEHEDTVGRALRVIHKNGFQAVPVIDEEGHYVGTVTEGDFLWSLKNKFSLDLKMAEDVPIQSVRRRMRFEPISINSDMEDLVTKAMNQNFVPVIDDKGIFIGIVTRKDIIEFCYKEYARKEN